MSARLVDLVFEKKQPASVDFEIAFTALIATATFATISPQEWLYLPISVSAVALLALTLTRRMAVISQYADSESILDRTVRIIEFFSLICIFQIARSILTFFGPWALDIHVFSALLVFSVFIAIILQELVFGDFMIWWGAAFYTSALAKERGKANTSDEFQRTLLALYQRFLFQIAYSLLSLPWVIPEEDDERWNELRSFVEKVNDDGAGSSSSTGRLIIPAAVVLLIGYTGISWGLSFMGFSITGVILLLFALNSVRQMVGFWYLAYGSQTFSRFLQGNSSHLLTHALYAGVIYWFFFY